MEVPAEGASGLPNWRYTSLVSMATRRGGYRLPKTCPSEERSFLSPKATEQSLGRGEMKGRFPSLHIQVHTHCGLKKALEDRVFLPPGDPSPSFLPVTTTSTWRLNQATCSYGFILNLYITHTFWDPKEPLKM